MKLELTSLDKAIQALIRSISVSKNCPSPISFELEETIRSGIIQNFEVAYELSWKMIKRWLQLNLSPQIADGITRRELFRLAKENRLIDDVEQWMRFHAARNETAHSYDHEIAEEVRQIAEEFVVAAQNLLQALQARND